MKLLIVLGVALVASVVLAEDQKFRKRGDFKKGEGPNNVIGFIKLTLSKSQTETPGTAEKVHTFLTKAVEKVAATIVRDKGKDEKGNGNDKSTTKAGDQNVVETDGTTKGPHTTMQNDEGSQGTNKEKSEEDPVKGNDESNNQQEDEGNNQGEGNNESENQQENDNQEGNVKENESDNQQENEGKNQGEGNNESNNQQQNDNQEGNVKENESDNQQENEGKNQGEGNNESNNQQQNDNQQGNVEENERRERSKGISEIDTPVEESENSAGTPRLRHAKNQNPEVLKTQRVSIRIFVDELATQIKDQKINFNKPIEFLVMYDNQVMEAGDFKKHSKVLKTEIDAAAKQEGLPVGVEIVDEGLPIWAYVAISVGVVALATCVTVLLVVLARRRNNSNF